MANEKLIPFSLDSLYIVPIIEDTTGTLTYGTELTQCEGVQEIKLTPTASEYILEGDGGTVDIQSVNEGYEVEFTNGIMTFEQMQIMEASEIKEVKGEDGEGVVAVEYVSKTSDKPEYFGLIGFVAGSNLKVILPKVKVSTVELSFANKTHAVLAVKAKAIKRTHDGVTRKLRRETVKSVPSVKDFE